MLRRLWIALIFFAAQVPGVIAADAIKIEATPVPMVEDDPSKRRIGALLFLSGWQLHSYDARFGGFSGLLLAPAGDGLEAISDNGYRLSLAIERNAEGAITGFARPRLRDLRDRHGDGLGGKKRSGDAEGLSRDRQGNVFVSLERQHRVLRYDAAAWRGTGAGKLVRLPRDVRRLTNNKGLEALAVLADGRLFMLAERYLDDQNRHRGWIIAVGDAAAPSGSLSYGATGSFLPVDAAALPDGRVFVLERKFSFLSGLSNRITLLRSRDIRPGARLEGREIARWSAPATTENFEGLAVEVRDGETLLHIISDDNYSMLQSTILLSFRLVD